MLAVSTTCPAAAAGGVSGAVAWVWMAVAAVWSARSTVRAGSWSTAVRVSATVRLRSLNSVGSIRRVLISPAAGVGGVVGRLPVASWVWIVVATVWSARTSATVCVWSTAVRVVSSLSLVQSAPLRRSRCTTWPASAVIAAGSVRRPNWTSFATVWSARTSATYASSCSSRSRRFRVVMYSPLSLSITGSVCDQVMPADFSGRVGGAVS